MLEKPEHRLIAQNTVGLKNPFDFRCHQGEMRTGNVSLHAHHFTEVNLTLSGSALHLYKNKKTTLKKGSAYVVPRGASHELRDTKNWCYLNIYFLSEGLESRLAGTPEESAAFSPYLLPPSSGVLEWSLSKKTFTRSEKFMELLSEISDAALQGRHLIEQSLIQSLLVLFSQEESISKKLPGTTDLQVNGWLRFIDENLLLSQKEITSRIAIKENLPPGKIGARFQKFTGETFANHLIRRKILRTCSDLLLGELSFTDIAHRYGFYDLAHFSKLFKRVTGLTPRDYRESLKK